MNSKALLNACTNCCSVYQFDQCYSVTVPATLGELTNTCDPLWWMVSEGSSITTLLADGATTLQLAPGSLASAAGAWLVSKLLLIPEGANLPIGFGVLVDNMLLHETFLANLAAQHCNASHCMPCHFMVTGYLV